jgi:hypothetical protein
MAVCSMAALGTNIRSYGMTNDRGYSDIRNSGQWRSMGHSRADRRIVASDAWIAKSEKITALFRMSSRTSIISRFAPIYRDRRHQVGSDSTRLPHHD